MIKRQFSILLIILSTLMCFSESAAQYRDKKKSVKKLVVAQKLKKAKDAKNNKKHKKAKKTEHKKHHKVKKTTSKNALNVKIKYSTKRDAPFIIDGYDFNKEWDNLVGDGPTGGLTPEVILKDALKDGDTFKILFEGNKRAGFIRYNTKKAYIGGIYVDKNFRRKGYANTLLDAAEKSLHRRNKNKATLEVWSYNTSGLAFFKNAGYVNCEKKQLEKRRLIKFEKNLKA